LFVGYTTFLGVELARCAQVVPTPARELLAGLPGRIPRSSNPAWNDRVARWQKWAADTALAPEAAYRSKITRTGLPLVRPLLTKEFASRIEGENPFRTVDASLSANG